MTRDEQFVYDLLEAEFQQTEAEEAYMLSLLEDAETEYEEEIEEEYPLDPFFPDDDYLDADELWELTAEAYGDD